VFLTVLRFNDKKIKPRIKRGGHTVIRNAARCIFLLSESIFHLHKENNYHFLKFRITCGNTLYTLGWNDLSGEFKLALVSVNPFRNIFDFCSSLDRQIWVNLYENAKSFEKKILKIVFDLNSVKV
jgi:hypothetical protein